MHVIGLIRKYIVVNINVSYQWEIMWEVIQLIIIINQEFSKDVKFNLIFRQFCTSRLLVKENYFFRRLRRLTSNLLVIGLKQKTLGKPQLIYPRFEVILWCRKFCHFGMGFVIYPTMIMRMKIEYKCDTYRGCFNQICQNRRPIIKFQTRKPNAENSLHPHRRIVKSFHVQLCGN